MTSEERRVFLDRLRGYGPPPVPRTARRVGDCLAPVLSALGLADRLHESEVLDAWRGLVGDFLAAHSQPMQLKSGVLLVRVLQPTVHYELDRVWKSKILKGFQDRFGKKVVREIRFRL
jgi:predicted nucleic acid-binding Zn ribbon protein